jgi:O-antigen/teichoic acid export membrane protein
MSITRRIAFGAVASWVNRGSTVLLGILLMPVLFGHLPKEELGVWLLLGQSWAAMGILDLGIGFTLTRRIALARGKSGVNPNAPLTAETLCEIADLTEAGRRIYHLMAVAVFVVSWLLGFFYLKHLQLHEISHTTVWIAWTILCASQACAVWTTVWTCLLQGIGYVGWDALIASLIGTTTLTTQIVVVLCGGRLIALALVATTGALAQRWLTRWLARIRRPELFSVRGKWNPQVLKGTPTLALRAWLTSLGTVLIFNTDQFFIASSQGAAAIPAYRAAFLIVLNLNMLAVTFGGASSVFVSHLWQAQELATLHHIIQRNLRLGFLIILCGSSALLTLGPKLFDVWIGPGKFVGYPILVVFVIWLTLETQSFIIAAGSRATEDEAFAVSMLLGGGLKLLLSWLLMQRLDLLGIATGTLLAQLVTNNWYTVYRGLRRLRMSVSEHLRRTVAPALIVFAVAIACNTTVLELVSASPKILQVFSVCCMTAAVFMVGCWTLVLSPPERVRVLSMIRWRSAWAKGN